MLQSSQGEAHWQNRLSRLTEWLFGPEHPHDLIAYLKPGILDCAGEAMHRSRTAECEHMPAWLEHAEHLGPELDRERALAGVPLLAHEAARLLR
jgi:hypothetical protein